jgi:3-hydroxyacyl-[acyl-carrier-protein] dehydratase
MRWFWIDRFTTFVSGQSASAIKNVSLSDEVLDDYMPGRPSFPYALIIEGMAQTAGLLVAEMNHYQDRVVLAKVGKAVFHMPVLNGDQLHFQANLESRRDDGAIITGTTTVNHQLQSEIELTFAFLGDQFGNRPLFPNTDLLGMLLTLGIYNVGIRADGSPLKIPERLLKPDVIADTSTSTQSTTTTESK